MQIQIRDERPGDEAAIHSLTQRAFAGMPFSDGSEPGIILRLRKAGDLELSLVAVDEDAIIGHVAFSPLRIVGVAGSWFGLGPISVEPARQKQGVGRLLVSAGLERLRRQGAQGCALIGDPAVYAGMGFVSDGALTYGSVPLEYVQRAVFAGKAPQGELYFAPAFAGEEG